VAAPAQVSESDELNEKSIGATFTPKPGHWVSGLWRMPESLESSVIPPAVKRTPDTVKLTCCSREA
jgi:hypothetical protein